MQSNGNRLRRFNIVMGLFHAVQGVVILLLANDFALPVTATFLKDLRERPTPN